MSHTGGAADGERPARALDELIRTNRLARNSFADLEHATEEELAVLQREFERIRSRARRQHAHEAGGAPGRGAAE